MPYFLDSNVLIGYYFICGDRWGNQAKRLIEIPEQKHSSKFVWQECFGEGNRGKCNTILREIKDEFFNSIILLTKNGFSALDLYSLAIEEKWKILDIIQELAGNYEHDIKELVRKIRKAERKYEIDCEDRHTQLKNLSILRIHERDVEYPEIRKILDDAIEDTTDVTILLDAHHVGYLITDLDFVTGDRNHIVKQKEIIKANTNISNVSYLDIF